MIEFLLELGMWGGHYKRLPGGSWRATLIDRQTHERYAGSDDSPWLAIGWALHERALRQRGGHAMAKVDGAMPWDAR